MASSRGRAKSVEKKRVESRLVDTHTKQSHRLEEGGRLLIVSHTHLESLEGYDHVHKTLQLPPTIERDVYCAEVMVQVGKSAALVCVHRGTCYVNGEELKEGEKPRRMKNGTFFDLGASYQFQYLSSKVSADAPIKRVLPQTPGQALNGKPPSKPPRQQVTKTKVESSAEVGSSETSRSYSCSGSVDFNERSAIDEGLRARLKRIAKEIASRASGYQDRKPPPPYEQAGNSIGYQLLHQNHSDVTTELIDRLYPALKALESKDPSLTDSYTSYVTSYNEAREAGATPQCMLPGDIPTIDFITDVVVNLCCIPQMVSLSEKFAALFARILAILSSSPQNQSAMAAQRHTTKVLSCMNLTIMSHVVDFQQYGWTLLANTLATPSQNNKKPLLSEASLTLALSLIEQQLSGHNLDLELSLSIIKFLSVVAATAKRCTQTGSESDETTPIYTPTQASGIIKLLNDTKILRHVMKVPQEIRSDPNFECHYSVVVKCLAPTRTKRKPMLRRGTTSDLLEASGPPSPTAVSTPPPISTAAAVPSFSTPSSSVPPPKPKRMFRHRRSTVGTHSRNENTKVTLKNKGQTHLSTSLTVPNGHVTTSKDQATDHVTTSKEQATDHVTTSTEMFRDLPASTESHQTEETELKSASEVSVESDLYSLSCSALPDKTFTSESVDYNVPQSVSVPQLPQREYERQEDDQVKPVQELVKPVLSELQDQELPVEQDQEEAAGPDKSELEEPVKPDELVQQDQEKTTEPKNEQKTNPYHEENEHRDSEEAETGHRVVVVETEKEGEERDNKPGDQVSESAETKAVSEVGEDANDITVAADDVTTKPETAVSSLAMKPQTDTNTGENGNADTNTGELSVQANSKYVQRTSETVESRSGGEVAAGDGGDGKEQLGGEEVEGSQEDSQQNSARNVERLVDKTEQCKENSLTSLSVAGEEKGEEKVDEDTQNSSPSLHESSEAPPTIPEDTPPSTDTVTSESPLKKVESLTLGENSPAHSSEQTPPQVNSAPSVDTEELQTTDGESPQQTLASIKTGTPLSDATHDPIITANIEGSPTTTPDNSIPPEMELEREKSADSFTQPQDPQTIEVVSSSPEPLWSPNTASLARDVQDLLSAVQAPLEEEQMVRVPSISRNSRYYRVSVKGSTPKGSRRGLEESSTPKLNRQRQENAGAGDSPSDRPQWGSATPPSAVRGHAEASPFEVSGEFLSSTHMAIEDLVSGHQDMKDTLQARLEVCSGVVGLWHRDKGLQAATNLVQACFSTGKDLVLFIDILQQLLKHQAPWTLAVCFVLLPVLRQLLTTQTDERCVCVVCDVLHMILHRFSELILFSKGNNRAHPSRRLSSMVDREQQEVCYNELHNIRKNLHSRLDQSYDTVAIGNYLRKLHAALKQYKEPLEEK